MSQTSSSKSELPAMPRPIAVLSAVVVVVGLAGSLTGLIATAPSPQPVVALGTLASAPTTALQGCLA